MQGMPRTGRPRHVDDVVLTAELKCGFRVTSRSKLSIQCERCLESYSTSVQNERKKTQKWICGRCHRQVVGYSESFREKQRALGKRRIESLRALGFTFKGRKHSAETIAKMSNRRWSDESRLKFSAIRARLIAGGWTNQYSYSRRGWFITKHGSREYYASSYELSRMKVLDRDPKVLRWTKRHGISIQYEIAGKIRRYIPDFFVETVNGIFLDEVKGWIDNREIFIAKKDAAKRFADQNGWAFRVLMKEDLEC